MRLKEGVEKMKKVLLVLCLLCVTVINARAEEANINNGDGVMSIRILDKQDGDN